MRFSDLSKIFRNAYSEYSTLANGVRLYQLTAPVTPNVTTTTAPNGSWGITSHATGLGILFVSDGAFWQSAKGYLSYVALLTQTGTNAPVATVLVNELGGVPVWGYLGPGAYSLTLAGAFPAGKFVPVLSGLEGLQGDGGGSPMGTGTGLCRASDNVLVLATCIADGTQSNALITGWACEFHIYP